METLPTQIISADGANVIVKASGKVYLPVQENPDARMAGMPQDVSYKLERYFSIRLQVNFLASRLNLDLNIYFCI